MRRTLIGAVICAAAVLTACTPPPAPAPAPAPPAGVAPTGLPEPTPGYVLAPLAPLNAYDVTFAAGVPTEVRDAVTRAAGPASSLSGIALNFGAAQSPLSGPPRTGEIRVQMGTLCSTTTESGCAVTWGLYGRIVGTDMSINPTAVGAWYLYPTALHEFGHAIGLDHPNTNGFRPQIMSEILERLDGYQNGDRAGLAATGARAVAATSGAAEGVEPAVTGRHEVTVAG